MTEQDQDWRIAIMRFQWRPGRLSPDVQFLADDRHSDDSPFWVDSCEEAFVLLFDTLAEALPVMRAYPGAMPTCVAEGSRPRWGAAQAASAARRVGTVCGAPVCEDFTLPSGEVVAASYVDSRAVIDVRGQVGTEERVSEACRRTHVQACHICDNLACGDNTSAEAQAQRRGMR